MEKVETFVKVSMHTMNCCEAFLYQYGITKGRAVVYANTLGTPIFASRFSCPKVSLTHFWPVFSFLYPLKARETLVFWYFQEG